MPGMLQLLHMTDDVSYPWEDPVSQSRPRGRTWLWIGLPLFLGLLIIAGLVAAVLTSGFGSSRVWADVSLIFVLLPLCVLGLIPFLLLIAVSYGTARLIGWLPEPMKQLERVMERVKVQSREGSQLAVRPVIAWRGIMATIEAFMRGLIEFIR